MRKKYLVTTVAMLAAVSMLTACGVKNDENDTTPTPTVTVAPTEAPSSEERGDGPTTPTQAPTETPETTVDHNQMIQNVVQALKETYGSMYLPDMQMQEDEFYMKDMLGLDASWYDVAYVEVPGISFGVDKFIMIHPTEGNIENVQKALNTFREMQIEDSHQYPSNMRKLQAATVDVMDDYVCYMIFTGTVGDMMFEDEAAEIQAYTEANQMAKEIVAAVLSGELVVKPWTELDKMRNAIAKAYHGTYIPSMRVDRDEVMLGSHLNDVLKMDAAWLDEIVIEIPMMSVHADTLILVDPSDGNTENVLNALKAYKNSLVEDSRQYPMNVPRVNSAVVEQVGDYVCFAILGGVEENWVDMEIGEDDVEKQVEYYKNMNMNAIYALQAYLNIE